MMSDHWAADTLISMPLPPSGDRPVLVDFGGYGFGAGGLAHNITENEREALMVPWASPADLDFSKIASLDARGD